MPSRTLPAFTRAEVESHNTSKSCYVTVGQNVYDVTDFLDAHPGGPDLILDYAGKDIGAILKDEDSHTHTETAYEVLEDSLVGFVALEETAEGDKAAKGKVTNGYVTANGGEMPVELDAQGRPIHPLTVM